MEITLGYTPYRSRSEFLGLRIEILIVHAPGQVLRSVQVALHEGLVDDKLRAFIRKAGPLPRIDLLPHGLEVPLYAIHPDREDVH